MHLVLDSFSQTRDRTALIRIIGIGSPFGDDAVGLEVARMLAGRRRELRSDRVPIAQVTALVDLLEGAEAVILIDAVRSGALPGTIHEFSIR